MYTFKRTTIAYTIDIYSFEQYMTDGCGICIFIFDILLFAGGGKVFGKVFAAPSAKNILYFGC